MKTVLFGPFVGEFGWEMLFWHAWVNKVSQEEYSDYKKIVASFPGRESFYPYADEYWAHPEDYLSHFKSCNGYITDFWKNGFPRGNASEIKYFLGIFPYENWNFFDKSENQVDVMDCAESLLDLYKKSLPEETVIYAPFKLNTHKGIKFGVEGSINPLTDNDIIQTPIPFSNQAFHKLYAVGDANEYVKQILKNDQKIIALYPRHRINRRPDKNWSKANYLKLIERFQAEFPHFKIGIFGSPGDAYFVDDIPDGCIDFINLPDDQRMNIQTAALQYSVLALGSLSGAIIVARGAGVPTLGWGMLRDHNRFHQENAIDTETIYHPEVNPSVEKIFRLSLGMIEKKINYDNGFINWDSMSYLKNGDGNIISFDRKFRNIYNNFTFGTSKRILSKIFLEK